MRTDGQTDMTTPYISLIYIYAKNNEKTSTYNYKTPVKTVC